MKDILHPWSDPSSAPQRFYPSATYGLAVLFASCLLLKVPTSCRHLGSSTSALVAFVGPVGLRAPCAVSFREKPLPLCARCPCGPTCFLPPALSRCSPGPPPLPHPQTRLSYPSLRVSPQIGLELRREA